MLVTYALLIFALTSSVVALPPHQPFGTAWQTLQGHTDIRLFDVPYPEEPSLIYRWYRLKIGDVPTWPEDAVLEQVMQFAATDHRVSRVTYLKLKRAVENDGHEFHLQEGYEEISSGDVNDPKIPLEGYWGRADKLDTFTMGKARRAIVFDEVIKVRTIEGVRQIHFLEYDKVPCEHCYPALTVYELTKGWEVLQGNEDPRLLEAAGSNKQLYRWYGLKIVNEPGDTPTWSRDSMVLELVMQFGPIIIHGGVQDVYSFKLRRFLDDQRRLHLYYINKYSPQTEGFVSVNTPNIPLEGFWGRASKVNPEGTVGPIVDCDEVIEIRKIMGERKIRFLDKAHFSPALTEYQLNEEEAKAWKKTRRPRSSAESSRKRPGTSHDPNGNPAAKRVRLILPGPRPQ